MMSMSDLIAATQRMNEAADAYHGKIGDIDGRVAAKEAQVDTFVAGAKDAFQKPVTIVYDPSIVHTKTSLSAVASAADDSRSEWFKFPHPVGQGFISAFTARRFVAEFTKLYNAPPGAANNPTFSTDHSYTKLDLVMADDTATSDAIDAYILENGVEVPQAAGWDFYARSLVVPKVRVAAAAYVVLWGRFTNTVYASAPAYPGAPLNAQPQEITTFGGIMGLSLVSVKGYNDV